MPDGRYKARAATPEELDAYRRQQKGGGGDKPPSLKEMFRERLDDLTRPLRNRAKSIARREIFAMRDLGVSLTDRRLQSLDTQFNAIAQGGLKGTIAAYRVLRAYPAPAGFEPPKPQNG